jgi:mono/diheme cytochrome c family protein
MSTIMRSVWLSLWVALAAEFIAMTPAMAAEDPDRVAMGRSLARQSCLTCHADDATTLKAPGFAAIGAMPSTTELSIKVFLRTSHRNMPDIMLDERQIDAIAAYILDRGGK